MKAGLVLIVAGTWVLCQILGGDALRRLNIVAGGTPSTSSGGSGAGSSGGNGGGGYNGPGGGHVGGGLI